MVVCESEIESAVLGEIKTERRSTKRIHFRAQSMLHVKEDVEIGQVNGSDGSL